MQTHHRNRKRIIYLTPNPTTTPHSPQISSTLPKRKTEETKESFFGSHPESVPIYQSWETRPKQEQPQILQRIKWVLLSLWNWEVLDIVILMEEVGSICMWYSLDLIHRERERESVLTNYGDLGGWSVNCWIEKDVKCDLFHRFVGSLACSLSLSSL